MPRKKSPWTLKHLCLLKIAHNVDLWCHEYTGKVARKRSLHDVDVFDCFPRELLQDLVMLLKEEQRLNNNNLQMLLRPHMDCLDLATYQCNDFYYLTQLITMRCHNLKNLSLSHCSEITPKALLQLVKSLSNIQVLDLDETQTSDAVLSALGGHCHDLRKLNVSYCNEVTDAGISALCVDLQREVGSGGCLKLHSLSVEWTSVTEIGAICALNYLPCLKRFCCTAVGVAFYNHFRKLNEKRKFQLEDLYVDTCDMSQAESHETFEAAVELCPNISILSVGFSTSLECTSSITKFKSLCELCLSGREDDPLAFNDIAPIFQAVGNSLKVLLLRYVLNLDLVAVGKSCLNLKELFVYGVVTCSTQCLREDSHSDTQSFAHLEVLTIMCCFDFPGISYVHLLHILLRCRKLESLHLIFCKELTDQLIEDVLQFNTVDSLMRLVLEHCNNVNVGSIMALMKLQNPLCAIRLDYCELVTNEHYQVLKKMAEVENLDLEIEFSSEN